MQNFASGGAMEGMLSNCLIRALLRKFRLRLGYKPHKGRPVALVDKSCALLLLPCQWAGPAHVEE
jgi:hypothetical protein